MGDTLWLWGLLAVCAFWCVGVYSRMLRLRARSLQSFDSVAVNLARYKILVLEHLHPTQSLDVPAPLQELLVLLTLLDQTAKDAHKRPWNETALTALTSVGSKVLALWSALSNAPADLAGATLPERFVQDWDSNTRVLQHTVHGFNQILLEYNEAISQFPATLITGFLGFTPAGHIAIFDEK